MVTKLLGAINKVEITNIRLKVTEISVHVFAIEETNPGPKRNSCLTAKIKQKFQYS